MGLPVPFMESENRRWRELHEAQRRAADLQQRRLVRLAAEERRAAKERRAAEERRADQVLLENNMLLLAGGCSGMVVLPMAAHSSRMRQQVAHLYDSRSPAVDGPVFRNVNQLPAVG
jgi:glycine/D-amino acid oxidase-like deaminating enzyme